MMERNNNPQSELTKSPWEWLGNAGNWGLLGQNGITFDGPNTADGKLKAVAPELLQVCKELAAWITIAPEFQDWPAAKSRLRELNKIIVKADPTHPVLQEAANVPH